MNLKYLRKLRPILNRVGKKHGIPVDEGEFIIGNFFKDLREVMYDPRVPKVMLPLFGTFQPKISYIYRSLRASIRFYNLGGVTREYIKARIARIWGVRSRLIDEKRGINTWKEWKQPEVKEKYEKLVRDEQHKKKKSVQIILGSHDNPKKPKKVHGEVHGGLRTEGCQ